jgi:hypothetical protein
MKTCQVLFYPYEALVSSFYSLEEGFQECHGFVVYGEEASPSPCDRYGRRYGLCTSY